MAKKTSKKENNEKVLTDNTVVSLDNEVTTEIVKPLNKKVIDKNQEIIPIEYSNNENNEINDISELIALEKACALICKRYESAARIDKECNGKFKEFTSYYEKIFKKLETIVESKLK